MSLNPTLTELWSEPGVGKTHQAHSGWPAPYHLDTAFTSLGFRQAEIEPDPDERGESWPVILKLYEYDSKEALKHYEYLSAWPSDTSFIPPGTETVIIDNAPDLRVLAVNEWCEENNQDWPAQNNWGKINDMVDSLLRELNKEYHLVVISQLKAEYIDGDKTGGKVRDGPKRMEYKSDFRVELEVDAENERHAKMHKNRFMDMANLPDNPYVLGSEVSLESLFNIAAVPEDQWK